ncbi:MAG: valyl-tRNA synthetase [Sphingobacteriales bacterium]|jgi:valyl-tRNA synthetase
MSISTKYNPSAIEDKWYKYWLDNNLFKSTPDEREPYSVVIPPPNVTGVLHMGHMLNNTIQDVLVRRARMSGKNACWVPGTDHASIATEAKVVKMLEEQGIPKSSLTRETFLSHAWEWKEKYGGIILEQLKKIGASCDWDRTRFTMEEDLSEAVIKVFCDLHEKGLIYRGARMVNWDPTGKTAVSDEEVIHKEVQSKLYYVSYKIKDSDETITVATTRPETIIADTGICVHPNDPRFQHLVGKTAIVPLINREVPIVADDYIDMEFGTGCLKVTPAHDINDYNLGLKHKLPVIDMFEEDGTVVSTLGMYKGVDRFVLRKTLPKDLDKIGQLIKVEDYKTKVGYSERTDSVIEPRLSTQWFLQMEKLAKPALEAVMSDEIKLYPPKFKNTYKHWMENVHDWCISRQLWWGHQIPAFYLPNGELVVAETPALALEKAQKIDSSLKQEDLKQDEDVLDTWFSSWLWPISVFDGFKEDQKEIDYYYPTADLVTAPEILFFWVARMIMAGYEYKKELPFKNVYLHGIVRDKQRRKMSKSLGNSPDPLDMIKENGADAVRMGMLLCAPAGNDILFDESLVDQGRNFTNKIWNAYRLVTGWEVDPKPSNKNDQAIKWFNAQLSATIEKVDQQITEYRLSEALMSIYKLIWDDFCSWYLEMIKPEYQKPIDAATLAATIDIFDKLMRLLHPFMPFISEELWQELKKRKNGESICVTPLPKSTANNPKLLEEMDQIIEIISQVRMIRSQKNIAMKVGLNLAIHASEQSLYTTNEAIIKKLCNLEAVSFTSDKIVNAATFIVKGVEFYVPMEGAIDVETELAKLREELKYTQGFLFSVEKKLGNERFVQNAKEEIVNKEKQKKQEALDKIKLLEENISVLNA